MPVIEQELAVLNPTVSPWFMPAVLTPLPLNLPVPLQRNSGYEHTAAPDSYIDRQVGALREWLERGDYLDHLATLVIEEGHSMTLEEFRNPDAPAGSLPLFDEIEADVLARDIQAPPPDEIVIPIIPDEPEWPSDADAARAPIPIQDNGQSLEQSLEPTLRIEPLVPQQDTPTEIIEPVDEGLAGRHHLRTPGPAASPIHPATEAVQELPAIRQEILPRRKRAAKYLGAAILGFTRRLGLARRPQPSHQPRLG